MTATGPEGDTGVGTLRLVPGESSPRDIATSLLPEDRERFQLEYERALSTAKDSLNLEHVTTLLEQWRPLAVLQSDPDDFAALVRTAAERVSGEDIPVDEPLAVTRARIGL